MNVTELKVRLDAKKIPNNMYSLLVGGYPNEAFCLVQNEYGWEVYYSERGKKRGAKQFSTESAACEYLEKKLDKYSTI